MTPDEAISFINNYVDDYIIHIADTEDEVKALGMAKEALRKTIKKKPEKMDELSHRIFYQCSVCKLHIYQDDKYCRHCGQAIDWTGV